MPVDRETGRPRGFAFVEFADRAKAEEVIRKFDAQPFQGRPLAVSEARAREDRPPRPPGLEASASPRRWRGFGGPRPGGGGFRRRWWRIWRTAARRRWRRFTPRGPGGPPPGPGGRDRSANFGPPAPPRRLRNKKGTQQDHKPRGPIKERSGGRIYAVDDLEDDSTADIDDVATSLPEDATTLPDDTDNQDEE
jgi:RNA recognition motif-containing protein